VVGCYCSILLLWALGINTEITMIADLMILFMAFGCGFILIGYENHARIKGWPVGEWLSGDAPFMKVLSVITMLISLGLSFYLYSWWTPLLVFILGFIFGFIATQLLKSFVQFVAITGTVVGWVLCLVYVL
jgi:hypothetical protein